MKIDLVRKDDEHKVMIRAHDDESGVILLSISATDNGIEILAVDANLKHRTPFRVAVADSVYLTHVPLIEKT